MLAVTAAARVITREQRQSSIAFARISFPQMRLSDCFGCSATYPLLDRERPPHSGSPDFFGVLRKGWLKLLLIAVIAGGAAFGLSLLQSDKYEASADLLFQKSDVASTIFGNQFQDSNNAPERVAATNLALASLDSVARQVKRDLNIGGSLEKFRCAWTSPPRARRTS